MGMVGLLAVLELADMEDFIEVMVSLEETIIAMPDSSLDYVIHLLNSIHGENKK